MSTRILVNGETFTLFKQVDFSRDLDNFLSEARITLSPQIAGLSYIVMGDEIKVYLDDHIKMTGWVDKISNNQDDSSHDVDYTIRDKTQDIEDSCLPDNVKAVEDVKSLKSLAQLVVKGLGMDITVDDETDTSITDYTVAGEVGQKCGDFLRKYVKKAGTVIGTSPEGNIIIRKPSGSISTQLTAIPDNPANNIESVQFTIDWSQRFNKVTVYSNEDISSSDGLGTSGVAYDSDVRESRIYEETASTTLTAAECKKAAKRVVNLNRARSFSYTGKVSGFSLNGELLEEGKLITVKDTYRNVIGRFIIKKAHYTASNAGGEVTELSITYPDAYLPQSELTTAQKNQTTAATSYIVQSGDTLHDIAEAYGIPLSEVIAANPQISNPDLIYPGGTIKIPEGYSND